MRETKPEKPRIVLPYRLTWASTILYALFIISTVYELASESSIENLDRGGVFYFLGTALVLHALNHIKIECNFGALPLTWKLAAFLAWFALSWLLLVFVTGIQILMGSDLPPSYNSGMEYLEELVLLTTAVLILCLPPSVWIYLRFDKDAPKYVRFDKDADGTEFAPTPWHHSPIVLSLNKVLAPTNPDWWKDKKELKEDVRLAKRIFDYHRSMVGHNPNWQMADGDVRALQKLIRKYANVDYEHPMWEPLNKFPEYHEHHRGVERQRQRDAALDRLVDSEFANPSQNKDIMSPDGKFMWTGEEWIPAPPKG